MGSQLSARRTVFILCALLFALNALFCWRLFSTEYLDDLASNEGTFITFGKFLLDHWPHVRWFPWFNAGLPFENTYLPLTASLVALGSFVTRYSPAHVFHFVSATAFSLAPVFWFLFARRVSGRLIPSFFAALLWSLFSPAFPIRRFLEHDPDALLGSRRLMNIVYFGETPHNLALCLLPVALLALTVYLETPSARKFAMAAIAFAAVMLSNAFGLTVLGVSCVMLVVSRTKPRWTHLFFAGSLFITAYLLICRVLPPSLIQLIRVNSPTVDGDFRLTPKSTAFAILFVIALVAIATQLHRLRDPMLRFAALFSACYGGIAVAWYSYHLGFLPQPHRYDLEMEIGFCLLAAFILDAIFRRLPARATIAFAALCVPVFCWIGVQDYWFGRHLIQRLKMDQSPVFEQAQWTHANLPGQRVLISEYGPWFNLFSNNPQLSAGHEPTAPNRMQRLTTYMVYAGPMWGDTDRRAAIFWLKAFGCGAIAVQGTSSPNPQSPVSQPEKFDAALPLLHRTPFESIYKVPLRSTSLAHVIPASAEVTRAPLHGLDLDPARAYVSALEDPAMPPASLDWKNPDHARISATVASGDVVSIQETYDPGWRATVAGRTVPIHSDQLGMIVVDPACTGACVIDLEFSGGLERLICAILSSLTALALLIVSMRPHAPRPSP